MHATTAFLALLSTALALPSPIDLNSRDGWNPAQNSVVQCNVTSDKIISFFVGPQLETVLNDACASMLPKCAYPERQPNGTVCAQTTDWKLDEAKTSTQNANVEDAATGNKISGWAVKFSVTPAQQAPVMWSRADCYGYFEFIVNKQEPEGCHNSMGSGIGNMTAGGSGSLKDTVFDIQIVRRK